MDLAALPGLEHAHHHDVLHRDVKPENLMLAGDGRLRVTDFGIAAIVGDGAQRQTQTGIALGTPAYMAPEQLTEPERIGEHTDLWSASAVLYELLAGQVPYASQPSLHAALMKRATEDPRALSSLAPDLPPKLALAVMTGLARNIDDRFSPPASRRPTRSTRRHVTPGASTGWRRPASRCSGPHRGRAPQSPPRCPSHPEDGTMRHRPDRHHPPHRGADGPGGSRPRRSRLPAASSGQWC